MKQALGTLEGTFREGSLSVSIKTHKGHDRQPSDSTALPQTSAPTGAQKTHTGELTAVREGKTWKQPKYTSRAQCNGNSSSKRKASYSDTGTSPRERVK